MAQYSGPKFGKDLFNGDKEMHQELKDLIKLGVIKDGWADGLSKREAERKFHQILSNDLSSIDSQSRDDDWHDEVRELMVPSVERISFRDQDMHDEMKDLIARGMINDAGAGSSSYGPSASRCYRSSPDNQRYSCNPSRTFMDDTSSSSYAGEPFGDDDEMNQEVKDMIKLGLIQNNWNQGLNQKEARIKFTQILSNDQSQNQAKSHRGHCRSSTSPGTQKNYDLVPLNRDDEIFRKIKDDLKHCDFEGNVKRIQRVHNDSQEKLFENEKEVLSGFDLNITNLYHGSRADKDQICSLGLDQRVGRQGLFGRGIYFSDSIKKCAGYGSTVYKCRVILGEVKEYPYTMTDHELRREPDKPEGGKYHSVKGNVHGSNEYVIYENRRSLIEYMIEFDQAEEEEERDKYEDERKVKKTEAPPKTMGSSARDLHGIIDETLREFLQATNCDDIELAKSILENQNGHLDGAINEYTAM